MTPIIVVYIPAKECKNEEVYCICHKCGKCGKEWIKTNDRAEFVRLFSIGKDEEE